MDAGKLCQISTTPAEFLCPERDMGTLPGLITNTLVCLSDGMTLYLLLALCSLYLHRARASLISDSQSARLCYGCELPPQPGVKPSQPPADVKASSRGNACVVFLY